MRRLPFPHGQYRKRKTAPVLLTVTDEGGGAAGSGGRERINGLPPFGSYWARSKSRAGRTRKNGVDVQLVSEVSEDAGAETGARAIPGGDRYRRAATGGGGEPDTVDEVLRKRRPDRPTDRAERLADANAPAANVLWRWWGSLWM